MLEKIREFNKFNSYIGKSCKDGNICVTFDDSSPCEDYLVIKVDDYYNSLGLSNTPKSVDCLIISKCKYENEYKYSLILVELKKMDQLKRFKIKDINEKFENTLNDFLTRKEFNGLLNLDYFDVKLYFVSKINPKLFNKSITNKTFKNKNFKYNGRFFTIIPENTNFKIKNCLETLPVNKY